MRKIHGAIAVPIMVGLMLAAVGCSSTDATTSAGANHTAAASSSANSNGGVPSPSAGARTTGTATAPTSAAAQNGGQNGGQNTSTSAPSTQAPFPGIWDITTWSQYRDMQTAVLEGHQPWLLSPLGVVQAWAAPQGSEPWPKVHQISANVFQVVKPGTNTLYTIHGICPDPRSSAPIWVITSISLS